MPTTASTISALGEQEQSQSRAGIGLALFATYVVWGSTFLGMRIALEGLPPFLMAGCRFILAGGGMLLLLRGRGEPWPLKRQWGGAAVGRSGSGAERH